MSCKPISWMGTIALLALPSQPVASQPSKPAASKTAAKRWTPPKTSWGDPDLQGVWPGTDMVGVPMERPKEFGTRAVLNDEEFARKQAHADEQLAIESAETVSHDPLISRGDSFVKCSYDPDR